MVVIKFIDAKNEEKALDCLFSGECVRVTTVKAKEGIVYDLELQDADKLQELGVKYQKFKDDELSDILDDRGLETLHSLRNEFYKFFPTPNGYTNIHINVNEEHVLDAKRIIDKYEPLKLTTRRCTLFKISRSSIQEEDSAAISTIVPKKHLESLVNDLANSGIAGYDREHQVLVFGYNK